MIIDGKKIAEGIQDRISKILSAYTSRKPTLAVILIGHHLASELYVARKTKACQEVGIESLKFVFPDSITEQQLIREVKKLNKNPNIDGILIQLPLPSSINASRIMNEIDPFKDVDGFHPYNIGKLLSGEEDGFVPCTPLGIKELLIHSNIETKGKHIVVIGRSNIVGKPMAALLMQDTTGGNATVTIAHRHTRHLPEMCLSADIIIAAMGQPLFIKQHMVREGAVVIDVGINRIVNLTKISGFSLVGDVDFTNVAPKCAYITPVPGGVGPMTIAMLLQNTLKSYQKRLSLPIAL